MFKIQTIVISGISGKWFDLIDMPRFETEEECQQWLAEHPQYNDGVFLKARIVPVESEQAKKDTSDI